MTRKQKIFSAIGRFFKNLFTKNIPIKIAALLFALLLWGYVLTMENPEYVKRVRGVTIAIEGMDTLKNYDFMLVDRELDTVDVDILCKINKHSELDASRITCTVDLSKIAANALNPDEDTKTIEVSVDARMNDTEHGTISGYTPATVELTIARTTTRTMNVEVKKTGTMQEGYLYDGIPETVPLSLNGQKSVIDRIASAVVTLNLDAVADKQDLVLPVAFFDSTGQLLEDVVDSNNAAFTVEVPVTITAYRDVPVEVNVVTSETFEEQFECEYETPQDTVRLIGEREVLDTIGSVVTKPYYPAMAEGTKDVTVQLIVPVGTTLDESSAASVTFPVTVTEKTVEEKFEIPLIYSGLKDEFSFAEEPPETVAVTVSGKASAVQTFDPNWITAIVELQNYTEGTHKVPISVSSMDQTQGFRFEWAMSYVELTLASNYTEEPVTESFEIPISYTGLGEQLELKSGAPAKIRVSVTGTAEEMQAFDPSWITATVDLGGLGAGEHETEVHASYAESALLYRFEWPARTVTVVLEAVPKQEKTQESQPE